MPVSFLGSYINDLMTDKSAVVNIKKGSELLFDYGEAFFGKHKPSEDNAPA